MCGKTILMSLCIVLSFIPSAFANPDGTVIEGDLRITGSPGVSGLVFPDGSVQYKATVQGPQGPVGPQGPTGPANNLAIGNVLTGEPGSAASATITGASPNQILNLTLPQGPQGPTGPAGTIFPWVFVTSAVLASSNTGYFANAGVQAPITLPANPAMGDIIRVFGYGGGWRIIPNPGQYIQRTNGTVRFDGKSMFIAGSYNNLSLSDNGTIVCIDAGRNLFVSTDNGLGLTWVQRGTFDGVTIAADGSKIAAFITNGQIYISTNNGVTWSPGGPTQPWNSITSSDGGTKLFATTTSQIYSSIDGGTTWNQIGPSQNWTSITASADGTKLIAVAASGLGQIFNSVDSGLTWSHLSTNICQTGTYSPNGTALIASCQNGINVSTDNGLNWINLTSFVATKIVSSNSGARIIAAGNGIYTYPPVFLPEPSYAMVGYIDSSVELIYIDGGIFRVLNSTGNVILQQL